MRGKHLPLSTWTGFLKTDSCFAEICTIYSLIVVFTVLPCSAFVVALRVRSIQITDMSLSYFKDILISHKFAIKKI